MIFEKREVRTCSGAILAHNISDHHGKRILRKGIVLTNHELRLLQDSGRTFVYVAELEPGDLGEAEAARRTAELVHGSNIQLVGAATGRTNLLAERAGVLQIDVNRLDELNKLPGITISTLRSPIVVPDRQMVASIKIIPYGISAKTMTAIENLAGIEPIVAILPLEPKHVDLILLGGAPILEKIEADFRPPLEERVSALGSKIVEIHKIPTDCDDPIQLIADGLKRIADTQVDLLILAGETAIMDPRDVIPVAIGRAGGYVETTGAPVDPGNLLMLAYIDNLPILGAPGCARSPKENVVDWVLPRLLSGEHLTRSDITNLGHGGLLEDIKERPFPRAMAGEEDNA